MSRLNAFISADRPYLADGGLETTLIFHEGIDLPHFAAFPLYDTKEGRAALKRYFTRYIDLAKGARTGFVLDTATWRAGTEWGRVMGLDADAIRDVNTRAVRFAETLRDARETEITPIIINGVVGPSGDGYAIDEALKPEESFARHRVQIQALAEAGADVVSAVTITHSGEGIGIARAAEAAGLPSIISYTAETDGRLPSGETLAEAVTRTDSATEGAPLYYMVNCAHPTHFSAELSGDWIGRIGGIRANASRLSHAELDEAEELDDGDPEEFGRLYGRFGKLLPKLHVIGGCCGTDHRHIDCAASHFHATEAV